MAILLNRNLFREGASLSRWKSYGKKKRYREGKKGRFFSQLEKV
jgi:hypothetical protein